MNRTTQPFRFSAFRALGCALAGTLLVSSAFAQTPGTIYGEVDNAVTSKPFSNARVKIPALGREVSTDSKGKFIVSDVPAGDYQVQAYSDGFNVQTVMAHVGAQETANVMIELTTVTGKSDQVEKLEELVVNAGKVQPFVGTHNIDIPRSANDVQPYYIWSGNQIDSSGATDINDFFSRMVPMNSSSMSNSQVSDQVLGNVSNINLGGLNSQVAGFGYNNGTQNTLILLDGRRLPSMGYETQNIQPDISGIPLAQIDRIEVLPASASAIYGASAAGGVVNIILKHDYTGAEFQATYDNTFNTDSPLRKESLSGGLNLDGGKTNILFSISYSTLKPLELQDREGLVDSYESRYFAGYPGGELAYTNATLGTGFFSQPLIISSTGKALFSNSTATVVQVPVGYQSFQVNGLAPLQANVGNFNLAHPNDASFRTLDGEQYFLTQGPEQKSMVVDVRQKLTDWVQAYVSFLVSSNYVAQPRESFDISSVTVAATNPFNPFGQAVKVSGVEYSAPTPESTDRVSRNLGGGLIFTLPHGWSGDLDFTWADATLNLFNPGEDTTVLDAAIAAGTVNIIADLGKFPIPKSSYYPEWATAASGSTESDITARAVGPLMHLWGGAPLLSTSVEHYRVGNITGLNITDSPMTPQNEEFVYYTGQSSFDTGAAAELKIPVVSDFNRIMAVQGLDLQFAARFDDYSNTVNSPASEEQLIRSATTTYTPGGTAPQAPLSADASYRSVNETAGFKWTPIDDVTFRASYASGFAPPVFSQLIPPDPNGDTFNETGTYAGVPTTSQYAYTQIIDPLRGNAAYYVPVATGGNPNLKPETSKNVGAGIIVTPRFIPGLRISLDYARLTKHNNIIAPTAQLLVSNAASFPGQVVRGPLNPGDTFSAGPITQINATDLNGVESIASLYNLQADYAMRTGIGTFTVHAIGTFYQHYEVQATIGSPLVEYLANPNYVSPGLGFGQTKFKGNLGLNWTNGPWNAGWLMRYTGPYTVGSYYGSNGGEPLEGSYNGWVPGQLYHDVNAGFRIPKATGSGSKWRYLTQGISIQVGVKDIFNHAPPYDAIYGIAPFWYSTYGSIDMAEYYITFKKSF